MTKSRVDLGFGDDGLDLSGFQPVKRQRPDPTKSVDAEIAAEASGFRRREERAGRGEAIEPAAPSAFTPARRRRTGRTAQPNLKARPDTIEAYCALADKLGWGLAEAFEKALELLQERYGD